MILKIEKELFQWEKGRYVTIELIEGETLISYVQFYNKKSKFASEISVINNKAEIPNFLLTEALPITALACVKDESGTKVISRRVFKVLERVKPEFYEDENIDRHIIYEGGQEI